MISVQNHLLQLSGNKWLWLFLMMLGLGACSPKVQPPAPSVKTETEKKPEIVKEQPKPVPPPAKTSVVSLILPFALNNLSSGYTNEGLKQANLSVDFYQGFKMALDSLTSFGYNYELHVYDSQGQASQSHALAYNSQVRVSDLVVGPVFPDDMKAFASVLIGARNPAIVSPLSPAAPSSINNQNLITVAPPLQYHALAAARYAIGKMKAKRIFILNSGFTADKEYIGYFKKAVDSLTKKTVQLTDVVVSKGDLSAVIPRLSLTADNVFVVPSTNQQFLMVTLQALEELSKKYSVTVFGHPNWEKYTFLKADLLQRLKTHITNSDRVSYKASSTLSFLRSYRKLYKSEPSEYAIKGFDEGMYFGKLLASSSANNIKPDLEKTRSTGMHNNFNFVRLPGVGWVNTSVDVLTYANFELKKVE